MLTASDLNAEINNVLSNPVDLWSPAAKSADMNGFELIMDSDGDSSITADTDDQLDVKLGGADIFRLFTVASAVNGIDFYGSATGNQPYIRTQGTDSNFGFDLKDSNGNEIIIMDGVASAVNEISITNAATGNPPILRASGEANIGIDIQGSNSEEMLTLASVASAVNEVTLTNAVTTANPIIEGTGDDTNISLTIRGKGTGELNLTSAVTIGGQLDITNGLGPHYLQNIGIAASVSSDDLTIAIKGRNLSDPSSTNKVQIAFQNATIATGDYSVVSLAAASSIVLLQGGTLGYINSEDGYVYVYAINNAGTIEPAIAKKAFFDESILHTTVAIGTGSDSDNVLYSTTQRSDVAVRLVSRVRVATGATAGDWSAAPTEVIIWSPWMKKTGDIVQTVVTTDSAVNSDTTQLPSDDSLPQSGEGVEFITRAITPKSTINNLRIEHQGLYSNTAVVRVAVAIFQDSTADAIFAGSLTINGANDIDSIYLFYEMAAGTISSTTFKIRAGGNGAGTTTYNGSNTARLFGGVSVSFLRVTEIQA